MTKCKHKTIEGMAAKLATGGIAWKICLKCDKGWSKNGAIEYDLKTLKVKKDGTMSVKASIKIATSKFKGWWMSTGDGVPIKNSIK